MFATLHTNHGDIRLELFPHHAPKTVENFVGLAEGSKEFSDPETGEKVTRPFYDGVIFHRIISGFMLQGGDPLGTGTGGPGYTFDDEISEKNFNEPYVLAMANAGKRRNALTGKPSGTNGSQFFITVGPTPHLQGKHTVFGAGRRRGLQEGRRRDRGRQDRHARPSPRGRHHLLGDHREVIR